MKKGRLEVLEKRRRDLEERKLSERRLEVKKSMEMEALNANQDAQNKRHVKKVEEACKRQVCL